MEVDYGEAAPARLRNSSSSAGGRRCCEPRPKRRSCVRDFPPGCGRPELQVARPAKRDAVRRFPGENGTLAPPSKSSGRNTREVTPAGRENQMRNKVKETLKHFREICRQLERDKRSRKLVEATTSNCLPGESLRRVDLKAAKLLRSEGKYINTRNMIGPVPGTEVGDKFQYRVELNIVGLHRRIQNGIDYLKGVNGRVLAISIVSSGEYDHVDPKSGNLIYMGEGGRNWGEGKSKGMMVFKDQRLVRGNLALRNSIEARNPVRVIRRVDCYQYDGLYFVKRYWQERGSHGKLVFMYELERS